MCLYTDRQITEYTKEAFQHSICTFLSLQKSLNFLTFYTCQVLSERLCFCHHRRPPMFESNTCVRQASERSNWTLTDIIHVSKRCNHFLRTLLWRPKLLHAPVMPQKCSLARKLSRFWDTARVSIVTAAVFNLQLCDQMTLTCALQALLLFLLNHILIMPIIAHKVTKKSS